MIEYNDLKAQQRDAVDVCVQQIRSGSRLTKLAGFAGTGKTTIAGIIAEHSGMRPKYAAYTGKAAFVLSQKGYPAQTIHSLIMQYKGKKRDKRGREKLDYALDERKAADLGGHLLVLDETSMIGKRLGADIMSIGVPVLAIGDPFQLPPVNERPYFRAPWDARLTEVVRHEGIILDLATNIRKNGIAATEDRAYDGLYEKASPRNRNGYLDFEQILVGRNETRHAGNIRMRRMLGHTGRVALGERIVCLENNNWLGCYNGQQFTVLGCQPGRGRGRDRIWAHLSCECNPNEPWELECDKCGWSIRREVPLWDDEFTYMGNKVKRPDRLDSYKGMVATYGYVLTVNKAQGSEWDSVLVIDESSHMGGNSARWLYTAVTRASGELALMTY